MASEMAQEHGAAADGMSGLAGRDRPVTSLLDGAFFDGAKLSDAYLIDKARDGSSDAFEVLVVRHRDRAYRVALRMTGDHASAEDVAQEALVSAWRSLAAFRGEAQFSTWLHRIVVNAAIHHISQRRHTADIGGVEDIDQAAHPEVVVESKLHQEALRGAILDLPLTLRAPLVLHQFEGLSYEEVATILETSVDTVRGRIFRARRRLVASMREWR